MGDRRWTSIRKSGMTVLGKVPKPINLPSQRLENHGLDPTVEIVPKGTITWGSGVSATTPNAWASSASSSLSIDGGGVSPNNGRPTCTSSSGSPRPSSSSSGPCPSTAASENSHEPASNRVSSSRPSSASGLLVSNQSSRIASRPRSAETRPGSSQLSRFAESVADNSISCGSTKASNGVGTPTSLNDAFSLSSGDFPTLGSEKNSESRGHSYQGRPGSTSGQTAAQKELQVPEPPRSDQYSDRKTVNSWSNGSHQGGVGSPNLDNWKRAPQHTPTYSSDNMQHQQFEPWHGPAGPLMQPWNGPPGGPYGSPAHPGTYHAEPFTYYAPQMPGRAPNSHGILRPAAGPCGYGSNGVESYPPRLPPDPYIIQSQPMIQFRPGVYPGPLPLDGYFGPLHINARPVLGNQCNQNATLVSEKFHARHGPQEPLIKAEHKESDDRRVHRGWYKILLKHHDGCEVKEGKEEIQQSEVRSLNVEECGHDVIVSLEEETGSVKSVHDQQASSGAASESEGSSTYAKTAVDRKELEPTPISASDKQNYPAVGRNATLTVKIEGLNNKLRVADRHIEVGSALDWRKTKTTTAAYTKGLQSSETISQNDAQAESHSLSIPNPVSYAGSEPSDRQAQVVAPSAAQVHGNNTHSQHKGLMQGSAGYNTKSRVNSNDDNGWIKKSSFRDSQGMTTVATPIDAGEKCLADSHASGPEIMEGCSSLNTEHAGDGSYTASPVNVIEHQTQRAKMKEIATQRAKQLQREEEERAREQKAKALAKLEELNRRTSAHSQSSASECNNVDHGRDLGPGTSSIAASSAEVSDAVEQSNSEGKTSEERNGPSLMVASEPSESVIQGPAAPNVSSSEQEQEPTLENIRSSQCTRNNNIPKQEHAGNRRRQINETNIGEKLTATVGMENPQNLSEIVPDQHASIADPLPKVEEQDSLSQYRKNYKGSRNKNKLEGTSIASALPSSEHFKGKYDQAIIGSSNLHTSQATPKTVSIASQHHSQAVISQASPDLTVISYEKESLSTTKEQNSRVTNQWKPQSSRKLVKNYQVHKQIGKSHGNEIAFWAPVNSANKNSVAEEVHENSDTNEASNNSAMKNLQDVQNGMRTKRADIERYVPKNAPKDLAPAEKSQLQANSSNSSVVANLDTRTPDRTVGNPGVGKTQLPANCGVSEDGKPNRRGEMHTKQLKSSLPVLLQETNQSPVSSDITRTIEHAHEHGSTKVGNSPEQLQRSDGLISSTDNVTSDELVAQDVAAKAHGGTRRHRPQQFKSYKVGGTNHGLADEKTLSGKDDKSTTLSPNLKLDVSNNTRVDNHNNRGNHMRANWQPKSQTSQSHRPGSRGHEVGKIGAQGGKPSRGPLLGSDMCSLHEDQPSLQQRNTFHGNKKGHHEGLFKGKGVVTTEPSKKQTSFPNKASDTKLVSPCLDGQPESSIHSTDQKEGQHSDPLNRRQEALCRGRGQGHNGSKQKFHANAAKRRNGSRYEYQKIVPYDKPSDSFQENQAGEAAEAPQSRGSNNRNRDHHYPRRGGYLYGHSSRSAIRVNDSHDNTE